jgi:hypothetical protein
MTSQMGSKSSDGQNKENPAAVTTTPNRNIVDCDESLPVYYDSEPSSQPPRYLNRHPISRQSNSSRKPEATNSTTASSPKPTDQHRSSAQASTVATILASPYEDLDAQRRALRKKKTLSERWKDFKERNLGEYDEGIERMGSAGEWNVQGGRIAGGLATPHRRKSRK